MKTSELTGAQLDYWTGKALMHAPLWSGEHWFIGLDGDDAWSPSTNWAQGGPLIEKYTITPYLSPFGGWDGYDRLNMQMHESRSETPLIAICRAVVRSVFGDEVEDVK